MTLIQLSAAQLNVKMFKHPMLDGCKAFTPNELDFIAFGRLQGAPPEILIMSLRSEARWLIGRYLYHWPACRRLVDEMVGEAMLAITSLVNDLTEEDIAGRGIMKHASRRIRGSIEVMLNKLQAVSAPVIRTQHNRRAAGLSEIYLRSEREPQAGDKAAPERDAEKHDILEAVAKLRVNCHVSLAILDPDNWGLSSGELAEKLGTYRMRVVRCRDALLSQYEDLIE